MTDMFKQTVQGSQTHIRECSHWCSWHRWYKQTAATSAMGCFVNSSESSSTRRWHTTSSTQAECHNIDNWMAIPQHHREYCSRAWTPNRKCWTLV